MLSIRGNLLVIGAKESLGFLIKHQVELMKGVLAPSSFLAHPVKFVGLGMGLFLPPTAD